ncbi:MAG: hypothetical protein M1829_000267 [Trizodia sp. TS-e1964]|nr:MAG: hypothetical protein M1829_000267 [Trizodia sp. TS-e1964]
MKLSWSSIVLLGLASQATASSWFGKAAYNKWHETELERWLSDNNIPYPTPADRKDLENLIKQNWQSKVASPYADWDTAQLNAYLQSKGKQVQESAQGSKESLVTQVKGLWYETEEQADAAWSNVKDWIFDSWSDSQLKSFCDKHGITTPPPRKRDTIIAAIRANYESAAKKCGETAAYPGNWLYETWTESDLKEFLDSHGIPAPQPTTRDKLIAAVRRHSRLASLKLQDTIASASASADSAKESLSDAVFEAWSDSKIKEWADKNGLKVPQGSKRNELLAFARKHRAALYGDTVSASAASAFGAATSSAGNQYAKATDNAQLLAQDAFNTAIGTWSTSRLKAYLDARGVPVPQSGKKDELIAAVRLHSHKAASGWTAWTFDTWTTENLKRWLTSQGVKVSKKSEASRQELLKQAQDTYSTVSKAGGTRYASATAYLAQATAAAKDTTFDTWSDSDVKAYLDTYGVPVYQGSTSNEMRAKARNLSNYFRYGTTTPSGTLFAKMKFTAQWVLKQLRIGADSTRQEAAYQGEKAADYAKEQATKAKNRAGEAAQRAGDRVKEEL